MIQYLYRIGLALSMLINVVLGGPVGQTFSARQHEAKRQEKRNLSWLVDLLMGEKHCAISWGYWKVRKW